MELPERLGKYELLTPIAQGGMGRVFLARHRGAAGFERLCVVKRIHAHLAALPEFRAMLIDEARVSSLVRHPNVVPALDVVEEAGELALVLDYVEAVSLAELLAAAKQSGQPLAPAVVSRILGDTLAGLHAAHESRDLKGAPLEIVHRDVSPQNVLVGTDGVSRVIDFGIAKVREKSFVTESGVLKGKLRYMSPEQARRKPLDRRSDVFACGIVFYEALCGQMPFDGETEASVLFEILVGDFKPPVSQDGMPLSAATVQVLRDALMTDRDARFESAAAFRTALHAALPPADEGEVADAVRTLAGEAVRARQARIAALPTHAAPAAADTLVNPLAPTMPSVEETRAVTGPEATPAATGTSRRGLAAVAVVLVLGGALAVGVSRGRPAVPASTVPTATTPATVLPEPSAATPPPASPAPSSEPLATTTSASASAAQAPRPPPNPGRGRRSPPTSPTLHTTNPYGK
jgi:eukaryotic-like serine/threonine-protein kinase